MKLRNKVLALMVAACSVNSVYADGCGGGGRRVSFGNGGGFNMGPFHFHSSGPQYSQNYSTPHYHSAPMAIESSPQVIVHDPYANSSVYTPSNVVSPSIPSNVVSSSSNPVQFQGQVPSGQPTQSFNGQPMQFAGNQSQLMQGQNAPMQSAGSMQPNMNPGNAMPQSMPHGSMNGQPQMQPQANQMASVPNPNQSRPGQPIGNVAPNGMANPNMHNPQNVQAGAGSGLSALQILGSIGGGGAPVQQPQDPNAGVPGGIPTASPIPPSHFGTWVVNMNGNQMIRLSLNANNTFVWSAIKDGKESRLEGQYRLEGERLLLVRSSDLQQMAGTWTGNGANFNFKLDGAPDNGLAFARAQ